METLTQEEFKRRYGTIASSQLDEDERQSRIFNEIKDAFNQSASKVYTGINQAMRPGEAAENLPLGTLKAGAGVVEAVSAPLAPIVNRTIGPVLQKASDVISDIPAVQQFAQTKAGEYAEKAAGGLQDMSTIAGAVTAAKGFGKAPAAVKKTSATASERMPPPPDAGSAVRYVQGAIRDVVPTSQSLVDHNLARALDLTPGDLRNIAASTGNEVGSWMAQNNLIGTNKSTTLGLVRNFFTDNYKAVRDEISKVDTLYKPKQVPRYEDALKSIAAETQGKIGLEKVNAEIAALLKKSEVTLDDVQRVKELFDEHFSLYKITGDVQAGVTKQGLAKAREELKLFIEGEVQKYTGADIRAMNNNVSTARSLADAIEARSPRGLTRAQLTWRDAAIGMGLTYFGSPIAGLAAVAVWKLVTSPSIRLRFARWLDGLDDARRAKVSEAIRDNKLTSEMKSILDVKEGDALPTIDFGEGKVRTKSDLIKESQKNEKAENLPTIQVKNLESPNIPIQPEYEPYVPTEKQPTIKF